MRFASFGIVGATLLLCMPVQAQTAKPGDLGGCVWSRLPPETRQEFLSAYRGSIQEGMKALGKHDAVIGAAIAPCAGRSDIPARLGKSAAASQAIQNGAANELAAHGITAAMLEATWQKATPEDTQCVRANAAKIFGIPDQACPNPAADLVLLKSLNLSLQANRAAASQALFYFNAKAQEEWAEALMAKLRETR
jgi:hypothetical protein